MIGFNVDVGFVVVAPHLFIDSHFVTMSVISKFVVSGPDGKRLDYKRLVVLSSSAVSVIVWTIALIQSRRRSKSESVIFL